MKYPLHDNTITNRMRKIALLEAERGISRKLGKRAARHIRLRYPSIDPEMTDHRAERMS